MVPKGIGKGGGNTRREAAVDESRKEIPWQQTGKQGTRPTSGHLPRLPAPQTAAAALNVVSYDLVLSAFSPFVLVLTKSSSVVGVASLHVFV